MLKQGLFIVFFCSLMYTMNAQTYLAKNVSVRIFSAATIENIEANTTIASCAFNAKSNKIIMKVPIKAFKFEKALMQEHFNENYLESEKYPTAQFEGVMLDMPNMYNSGDYTIRLKGRLTLHGVTIEREVSAKLNVKDGDVKGTAVFKIKCKDYKIPIPKVVAKNIAEEIEISVVAEFKMIKY
jgi:polyisoprenoid-binding protein YceI